MHHGIRGLTKNKVMKVKPQHPIDDFTTDVIDGIQDPPSMRDIMKPLTRSMTLFGIYFWKKNKNVDDPADADAYTKPGRCKLFSSTIIYNITVLLALCFGLLRLLVSMVLGSISTEVLLFQMLMFSWQFLCAINGVMSLKSSTSRFGHLHIFYDHWQEKVASDFRELKIQYNKKILKRAFLITFVISWMIIAFNIVFTGILLFAPLGYVSDGFGLLFTLPFPTSLPLKTVGFIFHCYITCAWILPAPLVIISSLAIKYGFLAIYEAMERDIRHNNDRLMEKLRDFRKAHLNLCRTIDILDKDLNVLNVNWYAIYVPLTCFILYALVNFGMDIFSKVVFTFWLVTGLGYVAITSFFAASLHETAHSIQEPLLDAKTTAMTLEKHAELNLFLAKLNGQSIGFTVLSLITITKELLLTLVGLFVTYFFLILQFKIG